MCIGRDGSVHDARVIESDEYKDLALLKIEASDLAPAASPSARNDMESVNT